MVKDAQYIHTNSTASGFSGHPRDGCCQSVNSDSALGWLSSNHSAGIPQLGGFSSAAPWTRIPCKISDSHRSLRMATIAWHRLGEISDSIAESSFDNIQRPICVVNT